VELTSRDYRQVSAVAHRLGRLLRWRAPAPPDHPTGSHRFDLGWGVPVRQIDGTTCGPASILVARMLTDAHYARALTDGDPAAAETRLAAEQRRIHRAANRLWPRALGTPPWGVARELGPPYRWRIVDDTDAGSVDRALRAAVDAVADGYPVPVLIGNAVPRHYVLLVGRDDSDLLFYQPGDGTVVGVPEQQFRDGEMGVLGFRHVQAVVIPRPAGRPRS
jgi:hypothetical protein